MSSNDINEIALLFRAYCLPWHEQRITCIALENEYNLDFRLLNHLSNVNWIYRMKFGPNQIQYNALKHISCLREFGVF